MNKWLAKQGKQLPWAGHNYIDFVTEVRILTRIDRQRNLFDVYQRDDACRWLRTLALRIRDGDPIGTTMFKQEAVH